MNPNTRTFTLEECATLPFEGLSPSDAMALFFAIEKMANGRLNALYFPSQEVDDLRAKVRERFQVTKDWNFHDLLNANLPQSEKTS